MDPLHETVRYGTNELAPSEVQRTVSCSNGTVSRCTSLDGNEKTEKTNDDTKELELLLEDIAEIFINKNLHELYDG